jgi:hypothetical protein
MRLSEKTACRTCCNHPTHGVEDVADGGSVFAIHALFQSTTGVGLRVDSASCLKPGTQPACSEEARHAKTVAQNMRDAIRGSEQQLSQAA